MCVDNSPTKVSKTPNHWAKAITVIKNLFYNNILKQQRKFELEKFQIRK